MYFAIANLNWILVLAFPWLLNSDPVSYPDSLLPLNHPDIVVDWNQMAYAVAYQHDSFYSLKGIRALAMTHLAMHDALNAVEPVYQSYALATRMPEAHAGVAMAQAAFEVLANAYPDRTDTLSLALEDHLSQAREVSGYEEGVQLGIAAAAAIIRLRQGDGHEKQGDYTPMSKPGDYQYTPGWDGWVLKPDFDQARPFAMRSVDQFRSPPPPALESPEYAASYKEVKGYGGKRSSVRTADQTHIAHWWAEFAEHSWNRIGRIAARDRKLSAHEAARLFALVNMDIYDIYLASLESKYLYDTWRPITAVHGAAADGNPDTNPEPDWEPEMLTPPWPEYPSAHAAVAAGGAEVVAAVLGSPDLTFTMASTSAPAGAATRTYNNLDHAARDCAESRILNGYHFRFATDEGLVQGRRVARYILINYLTEIN